MSLKQYWTALYLSLVKSHLSYGSQVWPPETAALKKRIEGVQRRASLWILRLKRRDLTYVDCLKKLDLLPLSSNTEIKEPLTNTSDPDSPCPYSLYATCSCHS